MLKKLVALTLAALMLINPMTAMAVSWSEVKTALVTYGKYNDNGLDAKVEDGHVTVVGDNGQIENFFHSEEFKSYSFSGEIHFNGETFQVYVKENSDGTSEKVVVEMGSDVAIHANKVDLQAEDGTELNMTGDAFHVYVGGEQQTIVMIGENVVVTAADVSMNAHENASIEVTIDGTIDNTDSLRPKYDENGQVFDEDGNPVMIPGGVDFSADNNGSLDVTMNGTIATEDVHIRVDGTADLDFENNGEILAQEQVGIYAGENSEGTLDFTNNGEISVNLDTSDDIYDEEVDDNYIGGVMIGSWESATETTFTNTADGVVNGSVSGWLDNTNDGASITVTNQGEVTGDVGVWGNGGTGSITLDNQDGTIGGNLGTNSHDDISLELSNSGNVEGEMFADNQGTLDMTVTNSGDVNGLSVNNNGGANATVTNSGNVLGGEARVEAGSGSLSFSNTGTIDAERFDAHAYGEGTVTGTNSGTIDVEWGYVGSSENGESSFTNESDGSIHTDENFDLAAGNWPDDENYPGFNPENSSTVSFVNNGEVVTEGSFAGNLNENGSITLENTETGTMTAVNEGIHIGINGVGTGSVSVENAGTVNSEWFNVGSATTGEASITNTGIVNGYMGAYADGAYDDDGNMISANVDGVVSVTNTGTVTDGMGSFVNGGGTGTVVNTGDVVNGVNGGAEGEGSISVNNSGTAGVVWVEVAGDDATGTLTNDGTASYVGAGAYDGAEITVTNNNMVTDAIDVGSYNGGTADIVNDGTAENIYSGAFDGGTTTVTNNSTVNNEFIVDTNNGTLEVTNDGTVGGQMDVWAFGEEGSATATNNGTVGSSEDGNGVWAEAGEGGTVELTNDGTINGEIGGAATEGSTTTINNNGSAESAWINAHGGDVALNNEGTVKGTLSVSIGTQSNAVTDTETVAELLKQTGVNISGYESVDIYTANQNGELIARYSINEEGEVELEEVLMEEKHHGPEIKTKEMIRHEMEEKRKAAEIGGVFGSPYWLKQLYIGYMSLNLRLFNGEEQLLFKENISWVPGTGAAGEKVLTLNVKLEDTANLAMRLDGAVIDKLEQAGIVTINIVDGNGNLFMTYQVEDLKGAREMYGLTEKEYIVVGSADADVMKIAEDGTISPIEGETEAEPVEEVAEEAKAETEEEAAEETPAA